MVDVIAILHELERAWEAGSLPGRQSAELNSALRELHRLLLEDYYLRHCDLLHIAPNESGISFCPSTNIGQDSKLERFLPCQA